MAEQIKCAHQTCACPAMEDSDYCGSFCENADDSDIVEIGCECGHPGCE